jgi:hypothetical protein
MAWKFAVQQIREMRIVRQFFQRPPVLFAAFFPQFFANRGEIQFALAHRQIFRFVCVVVFVTALGLVAWRGRYDAKLLVVCLIAHIVR